MVARDEKPTKLTIPSLTHNYDRSKSATSGSTSHRGESKLYPDCVLQRNGRELQNECPSNKWIQASRESVFRVFPTQSHLLSRPNGQIRLDLNARRRRTQTAVVAPERPCRLCRTRPTPCIRRHGVRGEEDSTEAVVYGEAEARDDRIRNRGRLDPIKQDSRLPQSREGRANSAECTTWRMDKLGLGRRYSPRARANGIASDFVDEGRAIETSPSKEAYIFGKYPTMDWLGLDYR